MPFPKILASAAFVAIITIPTGPIHAERKVRLFILSGQSNMAGLKPEISFTPTLEKAFPDDELIIVKSAQGGQPIRRWLKDWKAPEGADVKMVKLGDLYEDLMTKVKAASKDKTFDSISFVWMQGERDAREKLSEVYEKSLLDLIGLVRKDLKRPDMTVVIGRLSDCSKGNTWWDQVRSAQESAAKKDSRSAWVDTDDLNGDSNALHYTKDGYAELGRRFADKTIELLKKQPVAKTPE